MPPQVATGDSKLPIRQLVSAAKPTVSVVVPTFNGQETIVRTLRSIAAQREHRLQIIVVDDGSRDSTVAAVEASGVSVVLVRQSNSGVSRARNAGAAIATGEYICFVDQDDIWHPDHVRAHLAALNYRPDAGIAVSPYQHWDIRIPPPPSWSNSFEEIELESRYCGWVFHEFMLDCWALTSASTLSRQAWQSIGGFDESREYGEDWDLWLRASRQTQFVKLTGPSVLYQQHPSQGSRRARSVDHRTRLLLENRAQYGLSSRDGRSVSATEFARTVARYRMQFGCHHLEFGDLRTGQHALLAAWREDPRSLRYFALWLASSIAPMSLRRRLRRHDDAVADRN